MGYIRQKDVVVGHVIRKRRDNRNTRVFTYVQVELQGPLQYLARHFAIELASSYITCYTKACILAFAQGLDLGVIRQPEMPPDCEIFSIASDSEDGIEVINVDDISLPKSKDYIWKQSRESSDGKNSSLCLASPFARLFGDAPSREHYPSFPRTPSSKHERAVEADADSIAKTNRSDSPFIRRRSRARSAERRRSQMVIAHKRLTAVMEERGHASIEAASSNELVAVDGNSVATSLSDQVDESDNDDPEPGPEPAPRLYPRRHIDEPRRSSSILPSDALLFCFPVKLSPVLQKGVANE